MTFCESILGERERQQKHRHSETDRLIQRHWESDWVT